MKVVLAQITSLLGDVEKNFHKHLECIENARKEKADLIIFPELSLTGYSLMDMVENVGLNPFQDSMFNELKKISRDISLVLGFVEEKERGLYFNSAAFIEDGEIKHIHRKVHLPNYGMFEEKRFLARGKDFLPFTTKFGKAGMLICYDFLHYSSSYPLSAGGADIIIVISAAPGRGNQEKDEFASQHMWELMGEAISCFSTSFVFYCNKVGFEDGKCFAGSSFIFGPSGKLYTKVPALDECLITQEIDLDEISSIRKKRMYRRDDRPELILHSLKQIISSNENKS
ncbi:MAG: nitrilase-related carbon-nitrogen hydrolase [Acidobacteriota bacterium]